MPQKSGGSNPLSKPATKVKDAFQDAIKETAKQVASTPVDALKGLISSGDTNSESSTAGGQPSDVIQDGLGQGMPSDFQSKIDEDRKKRAALIRHHQTMIQKYNQEHQKTVEAEEKRKQMIAQEEEQKKEEKKQIKKQQAKDPKWMQALKQKMGPGKGEVGSGSH